MKRWGALRVRGLAALSVVALGVGSAGCGVDTEAQAVDTSRSLKALGFEGFMELYVQKEPWEGGVFIYNGDTPVANEKQLLEIYEGLVRSEELADAYSGFLGRDPLIVNRTGGADDRWSDARKRNLTYCISNNFGGNKNLVVAAMEAITDGGWETFADVDFIYDSSQDNNCNANNNNVVFDVRQVSGQSYLARAFFPSSSRRQRNILVDTTSFNSGFTLEGIMGHEVGHALGFRHEHTRPEAGTCFENNAWRALTPYDSDSIMHYPQCNGTSNTLDFSPLDADGAEALYGPTGGGEPPAGGEGTPRTGSDTRTIRRGQIVTYNPLSVLAGTGFVAQIAGTGDADLYVRWDETATRTRFDCRPYLTGSNETCDLTVPPGVTQASIMVDGFRASTYTLTVDWVEP